MEPLVSVVVPVYNTEKYLRQCIDSLLGQTLREAEFIFVDDGSTDNSVAILEEYQSKDGRVKIIKQQNLHAGVARNNGMKAAKGKYLMFLDSDDFFELTMLEECCRAAEEHLAEIVVFKHNVYDDETGETRERPCPFSNSMRVEEKDRLACYANFESFPWNKMFLREFVLSTGLQFQDLKCSNDAFFITLAMYMAKDIYFVCSAFTNYRVNNSASLQGNMKRDLTCDIRCRMDIRQELTRRGLTDYTTQTAFNDSCHYYISCIFSPKYDFESVEKAYHYAKQHLIPDVFPNKDNIARDSAIMRVLESDSFAEFLWELRKADLQNAETGRQELKLTKSSLSYRIGSALMALPKAIRRCRKYGFPCSEETYDLLTENQVELRLRRSSGVNRSESRSSRVIVSLTSFPARMPYVEKTIRSLLNQSYKPDKIVLWLTEPEFPGGEADVPKNIKKLCKYGLEIRWSKQNLRSFTKLVPSLLAFPDDILVTADDDMYYPTYWLRRLMESYEEEPHAIHCHFVTKVTRSDGELLFAETYGQPGDGSISNNYLLLGVTGALYPPHSLHEDCTDKDLFMSLAPTNDDVWFWAMALRNGYPVRWVKNNIPDQLPVEGCAESTPNLWHTNCFGDHPRAKQTMAVFEKYGLLHYLEGGKSLSE